MYSNNLIFDGLSQFRNFLTQQILVIDSSSYSNQFLSSSQHFTGIYFLATNFHCLGEKPLASSLCGKSFRQEAHLAKHYQTV